jgi:iron complex transport system permease protein
VGLVVPHVMRYLVGANHRRLIPACLLAGGTFLPICDTLARQALYWIQGSSLEIPVGILTNLIGGVFFLYILLTSKQESPIA